MLRGHRAFQDGRDHRRSLIQCSAQSSVDTEFKTGCSGLIWLSLKTSRDTDIAPSLRNLLILVRYLHCKLLFLNNILWDPPHGNLYLSIVLMPHTFLIPSPQIPVDHLETIFSDSWISQLFLPSTQVLESALVTAVPDDVDYLRLLSFFLGFQDSNWEASRVCRDYKLQLHNY